MNTPSASYFSMVSFMKFPSGMVVIYFSICILMFAVLLSACSSTPASQPTETPSLPLTRLQLTLFEHSEDAPPDNYGAVEATTSDGEIVLFDITLVFKIDSLKAEKILQTWGMEFEDSYLVPTLRTAIPAVVKQYSASELYTTWPTNLIEDLQNEIKEQISQEGFIYQDFLIRNIRFSPEFIVKIENEITATISAAATATALYLATPSP